MALPAFAVQSVAAEPQKPSIQLCPASVVRTLIDSPWNWQNRNATENLSLRTF